MFDVFQRTQKPPAATPLDLSRPGLRGASAFWPMNEGVGSVIQDATGINGPVSINATWAPGLSGPALQFNNSSNVVSLPTSARSSIAGTVIVRANPSPSIASNNGQILIGGFAYGPGGSTWAEFRIVGTGYGYVEFGWQVYGTTQINSTYTVPGVWAAGQWTTYACTWENGGLTTAYVNGVARGSTSGTVTNAVIDSTINPPFALGAVSGDNYGGLIDYVFVSDRVLSPGEIAEFTLHPWSSFSSPSYLRAVSTIVPELTPGAVVHANGTSQVVPLTAFDHTLTVGSSPFSITGTPPAGVSITAQSVTTTSQGSVTLATGSTAGPLSITDGTATASVSILATSISPTPTIVPTNHPGHITLTLTGNGTSWVSGTTTFAFSGTVPTGCSIVSQSVASATSATVVITTGSGTGPLTITDGVSSGTVQVDASALSVSIQAPATVATGDYTIVFSNPAAVWTQETASTLFSISGWTGASLANIVVDSNSVASAALTLGTTLRTAGSATITDNSTGATTTFPITAALSGSIRAVETTVLAHTGGQTGLFSLRASATLGVWIRFNNPNLPIPYTPITLLGWTTGTGPNITYYPASQELTLSFPIASGGVNATTIAVQPGTGYFFGFVCSPSEVTIYLNGVLLASAANTGADTATCSGLQIGPSTSEADPTDISLHDLFVLSNYAATAADMANLASGAATPVSLPGAASAWWPLGGGTVGATPTLTDPAMSDLTGNGNTLSVLTGSLSSLTYGAVFPTSDPFLRSDVVSKCGKLVFFGMTSSYAAPGAGYQPAAIAAVNATPTVYRHGTPITVGPPTWSGDMPVTARLLQCGSITGFDLEDGGEGFTAPTVSWVSGSGGGTALTLGTPVLATGVATYGIVNAGVGWSSAPSITVMPQPPGWNTTPVSPIQATARAEAANGSLTLVRPGAGGLLGPGSVYTIGETITLSIGTGSGCQLTPTWGTGTNAGILQSVAVTATGKNYGDVWIVPVDPTGAGSGALLTATLSSGGISAVTVVAGGTGYSTATTFTIVPAWTFTGSATSGSATLGVPAGTDIFVGQGIYGAGIPVGTTATTGTAFTGLLSASSNTITGCSALAGITVGAAISGSNIPGGATITAISGSTVTMSQVTANYIGSNVPVVVTVTGLTSVTLSAAATATSASAALIAFNPTRVWARVGTYIRSLPVVSSSNDFTGPPSFTITDSPTPTRTATLIPFFSGVNAGDVVTYDAPASWLTPEIGGYPLGGVGAVTGQPIVNGAGVLEPAAGGLSAFAQPMTMPAGANEGGGHLNIYQSISPLRNKSFNANWQAVNVNQGPASTLTFASTPVSYNADPGTGGVPASWTNPLSTTIEKEVMVPGGQSNRVDGMDVPAPVGPWSITYSDPNVNTANATWVILSTYYGDYTWGSSNYVNLSGPNVGQPAGVGVVIDPRDIVFSGGTIQSIGTTYTNYGTGWQGAIVVATGGSTYANPWAIAVLPIITNGNITGFHVLMGGAGFSTNPTLTVYGTAVSGTQVTIVNDIQYPGAFDTLGSYEIRPNIRVAAASGTWQISNLAVTTPDQFTGQPQTYSPSVPLAGDTSFLGALTGTANRYAGCVRYMGGTEGPAGQTNAAYDADLLRSDADNWQQQQVIGFTMTQARCFNPDPSSTIYSWSSPKIYGPQAAFPESDPPFTISGTTTLGSLNVIGVTGPSLMVGSTITGPGIPSGPQGQANYISILTSGGFRLGYAATASGTSSLTVTNPPYFTVPPTDIGGFWGDPNILRYNSIIEFVTAAPHGLTSGQTVSLGGGSVPIPIEGVGLYSGASGGFPILVTGPSTFLTRVPAGFQSAFSRVASNVPIDLTAGGTAAQSWVGNTTWPAFNGTAMPHTAAAQITAALPGCAHWVTLPPLGTDGVFGAIARELAGTLDASNPVLMEYGNELWNDATNFMTDFPRALENVPAATAPGQLSFDGYMSDGTPPPVTGWNPGMTTLLGDHAYKTFEAAWAAAGMAPSRVKRVAGSFMIDAGGTTASHLDVLARAGSYVDYVAVAPYMDLPGDGTVVAAFAPGGSLDNAGAWPIDAINDFIRYWMVYSVYYQSLWEQQNQHCRNFGQPQLPVSFTGSAAVEAVLTPTTIASVSVVLGGSGYSSSTTATLYGGGGPTTTITPTITSGVLTGFTGLPTTASWTSAPWVAITDPTGAGSGAMATAAISPTSVASLVVVDPGVGYGQPGAVAIEALIGAPDSGTTAQAGAVTLSGSGVSAVALTSGGSGYTAPPSVSLYGGGVLPTGFNNAYNTYSCSYTYVDGSGNETTAGFSRTSFSIQTLSGTTVPNNMVVAQSPSLPAWASAMNFYITNGGQPGSETFYLSVSRSEWVAAKGRIPFNLPLPSAGARRAPLTCQVPASTIGTIPKVVTYEGAVEQPIPVTVPYYFYLLHDLVSHPAYHDTIQGWHFACQTGAQWITPPGGAVLSNYFMVFNTISVPFTGTYDTWDLAYSAQIPAGTGTSNQYATNQGGAPGDAHDHWGGSIGYGNVSTGLQGFKDWIAATSPLTVQPVISKPRKKRWFSGLGQVIVRPLK